VKYTDYDVIDFYAIFNEYHKSLGYAPFQPTNNARTGAGIYGYFYDLIAALRIKEFKALYYQKKETSELYKALDQVIRSPEYTVTIVFVYFSYVSCCFWYVHISV
jgi:hypothetical protein